MRGVPSALPHIDIMKIELLNKTVVYQGDTFEKLGWGPIQFPRFHNANNNMIGLTIHVADDAPHELGNVVSLISKDGINWDLASDDEANCFGTNINNQERLRINQESVRCLDGFKDGPSIFGSAKIPTDNFVPKKSENDRSLPSPIYIYTDVFGSRESVYFLDTLPDSIREERLSFTRIIDGQFKEERNFVDWKYRTVSTYNPSIIYKNGDNKIYMLQPGLHVCRQIKIAPDNSLWIAHYRAYAADPFTGVFTAKSAAFYLKSIDNGKTWNCMSYIPYIPNEEYLKKDIFALYRDGFFEPTLEIMDDGSMFTILRTCDVFGGTSEWGPTYISHSYDGGKTWEKPVYFAEKGALPVSIKLKDCVIAAITRPGIDLYISKDGKTWEKCKEVMPSSDRSGLGNAKPLKPNFWQWAGSCCNTSLFALNETEFLFAYSDFYVANQNGVKCKSIIVEKYKVLEE